MVYEWIDHNINITEQKIINGEQVTTHYINNEVNKVFKTWNTTLQELGWNNSKDYQKRLKALGFTKIKEV